MFALAVSLKEYTAGHLRATQVAVGSLRVIDLHHNGTFMTKTDYGMAFGRCEVGPTRWAAMTPEETL